MSLIKKCLVTALMVSFFVALDAYTIEEYCSLYAESPSAIKLKEINDFIFGITLDPIVLQDIDIEDNSGMTPLMRAICAFEEGQSLALFDVLLQHGADINHRNRDGETPFLLAVSYNHIALVDYLADKGANILALDSRDRDAVEILLDRLCDRIYCICELNGNQYHDIEKEIEKRTALCKILLTLEPAFARATYKKGVTPLMIAAGYGFVEIVQLLLEAGADKHARDEQKRNVFWYIARSEEFNLITLIMSPHFGSKSHLKCKAIIEAYNV